MSETIKLRIVKPAPTPPDGVILFVMVKNEAYLLPFFFEHYRALGVVLFAVYDDRSDAETVDILMAQPDCVIMRSDNEYGDTFGADGDVPRRLPHVLKQSVPESLFPGRWVLTVDADEFLILPSGFADLGACINALEGLGQDYATAPMVDFYGETLDQRNYSVALGPFAASPYFDAGPYYYWAGYQTPIPFMGGVRHRLLKKLCQRRPDLVTGIYRGVFPGPAKSWKVPLLKHGRGISRVGDHEITIAPTASLSLALAHFKFCPDLDAKIEHALERRQYYNASSEYHLLRTVIEFWGGESLLDPRTRRFYGARSLENEGLLTTSTV